MKGRLLGWWQGASWSRRILLLQAVIYLGAEGMSLLLELLAPLRWWNVLGWMNFYPYLDRLATAPWTLVSYILPHQHPLHLLLNLLLLYYLLPWVERFFGGRHLLVLYLGGALAGSVTYLIGYYALSLFGIYLLPLPLQGCSSALLAGLAALLVQPRVLRQLRTKRMRSSLLGLLLLLLLLGGFSVNAGGTLAHLGGLCFGLVYGLRYRHTGTPATRSEETEETDEALRTKLRLSGYASLSEKERVRLRKLPPSSPC